MHIWDDDTDGTRFHTCLCLSETVYYHHAGAEDFLTQEQGEHLVKFLKSECRTNRRYKTNWEYALSMWNDNNPDETQVDESSDVLDYTLLKMDQAKMKDIFDFDNIPMSDLDKAYIDYEPLCEDVDFYSLDEEYMWDENKSQDGNNR